MKNIELYPWQKECLDIWEKNNHQGIINVVTGAGKTVLAIAAIHHLKQSRPGSIRVRIVVPTTRLLSQWSSAILDYSGTLPGSEHISRQDIGYYYGSRKDSKDRAYMIYVINSARYALARHILNDIRQGYATFLIADECHHYASGENKKIFDFLPFIASIPGGTKRYFSLGLSATPQTSGYEAILTPALGREIYRYGFADAVQRRTISRFAIFQIALTFNPEENADYLQMSERISRISHRLAAMYPSLEKLSTQQYFACLNRLAEASHKAGSSLAASLLSLSYQRKALMCSASSRLACACKLIEALNPRDRIILFGERIEQADAIYQLLSLQYPNQVGRCHSKMEKQARRNTLDRYQNGEIRILVSCRALDEGFDVPFANVGIVLSCAAVERQRIQRLGRILRRRPDKDIASLYYLFLQDSVETSSFFPQIPRGAHCCSLAYSHTENTFLFPEYEKKAMEVLEKIRHTASNEAVRCEALKCLLTGMLRPDRFLGEELLEKNIRAAKTNGERNYWVCMKMMGREGFD